MSDLVSMLDVTSTSLQNILGSRSTTGSTSATNANAAADASTFDAIYNSAVNMVSSTNDYLHAAAEAEVAYATGELTSTHQLAVIEQEANLSLQYTVAIKNQLLSAYKEIMQMQI